MSHVTHCEVMSYMNESRHTWMNYVTHEWVVSHLNGSCHIWISHFTLEWFTLHVSTLESSHTWMSRVTYEYVTCKFQRFDKSKLSICLIESFQSVKSTNWNFQVSPIWQIETFKLFKLKLSMWWHSPICMTLVRSSGCAATSGWSPPPPLAPASGAGPLQG